MQIIKLFILMFCFTIIFVESNKAFSCNSIYDPNLEDSTEKTSSCQQIQCDIWIRINVTKQRLFFYQAGQLTDSFKVSTGDKKHETPNMERHPDGPMFVKYTSKKFPGGNYMGLGNMPYVTFIRGGYAIHGTTTGNIKRLGTKASHGCIRLHPTNAKFIYEKIKSVGLNHVWISIERS